MQVTYVEPDGTQRVLNGRRGQSAMDLAVRNRVKGIIAECGGGCICATCHVHVDADWVAKLPRISEIEGDTLDQAEGVDDTSRLSCQIILSDAMDGLVLRVAAEA